MDFDNEYTLLQEIYRGADMGQASIRLLLPKVKNAGFRSDLQTQYEQYQRLGQQAEEGLKALGRCPRESSQGQRWMLWLSIQLDTLWNRETSHLAEMMIQGSNMGIISLTKVLNSYGVPADQAQESSSVCPGQTPPPTPGQAAALAQEMVQAEEDNIQRLKAYLQ